MSVCRVQRENEANDRAAGDLGVGAILFPLAHERNGRRKQTSEEKFNTTMIRRPHGGGGGRNDQGQNEKEDCEPALALFKNAQSNTSIA